LDNLELEDQEARLVVLLLLLLVEPAAHLVVEVVEDLQLVVLEVLEQSGLYGIIHMDSCQIKQP
jgi:hypothetical protein